MSRFSQGLSKESGLLQGSGGKGGVRGRVLVGDGGYTPSTQRALRKPPAEWLNRWADHQMSKQTETSSH